MWKQRTAKNVRLGTLLFVLTVFVGIASQIHLLQGVPTADLALALGCVMVAISPVFITMGALMKTDDSPDTI